MPDQIGLPLLETDYPLQLSRYGHEHAHAAALARHRKGRDRGTLHGRYAAARFAASYPEMTERAVLYDPIGLTDVRWSQPWHSAEDAYKATMARARIRSGRAAYASIQRYFPDAWRAEYEQYVRILVCANTQRRLAPAAMVVAPSISRSPIWIRSWMTGRTLRSDAGFGWRERRPKLSRTGQTHRRHHSWRRVGDHPKCRPRTSPSSPRHLQSRAAEVLHRKGFVDALALCAILSCRHLACLSENDVTS